MTSLSSNLVAALEALLFVGGEPLSFGRLAKTLEVSEEDVATQVQTLSEKYSQDAERGLMLIIKERKVELVTKPEHNLCIESLTKSALQENLSKTALEVLSIIAYRSPITRLEIESIRGVNCSFTLRNLLLRGLIEREGNPDDARGYVYLPTFRLLESLGLQNVSALPDYDALSQDERLKMILEEEVLENPKEKEEAEEEKREEAQVENLKTREGDTAAKEESEKDSENESKK